MVRSSCAIAFLALLASSAYLPATATQLPAESGTLTAATDHLMPAGFGPCHWKKVCLHWIHGPRPRCWKWEEKKFCDPESKKPEQSPPKVHVPPFERRGPSFNRQAPSFSRQMPSFRR
jgi:hypothetical protein